MIFPGTRTFFHSFRIVFVPEENLFCAEESSEDDDDHSDESPSESLKLSEIQTSGAAHPSDVTNVARNTSQ